MIKVSIIVPIYNVEQYLKKSLDCLCNQTLKDIEIICVNDCSTDNSLEILKEYEAKDNRIKVISFETNLGAGYARNKGIEIAKGEYLGFVDPDDFVDFNFFEKLYNVAVKNNSDISKGGRIVVNIDGSTSNSRLNDEIKKLGKYHFTHQCTTAIYRRALLVDNNIIYPIECRKGQDEPFLNKCILAANFVTLVNDVKYYYVRRDGSLHADRIPIESIKSGVLASRLTLENINKSSLYNDDIANYIYLYANRLKSPICTLAFRNSSFESKMMCAEAFVQGFHNCLDKISLENELKRQGFYLIINYAKNSDVGKLAELLCRYEDFERLFVNQLPIYKQIFSIVKSYSKTHLILNFLWLRLKIKIKSKS